MKKVHLLNKILNQIKNDYVFLRAKWLWWRKRTIALNVQNEFHPVFELDDRILACRELRYDYRAWVLHERQKQHNLTK